MTTAFCAGLLHRNTSEKWLDARGFGEAPEPGSMPPPSEPQCGDFLEQDRKGAWGLPVNKRANK